MPYSVYGIYGAYIFDELKTLVSTYIRRIYIYIHQRWSDAYTAYTPYIYKHWSDVYAAYTVYIHIYQRWSDVYTAYTPSKYITDADALRGSQRAIRRSRDSGMGGKRCRPRTVRPRPPPHRYLFCFFLQNVFLSQTSERVHAALGAVAPPQFFFTHKKRYGAKRAVSQTAQGAG